MEIAFRYNRTCIRYLAPFLNSFFNPNVHTINLSTGVPGDTLSLKSTGSLHFLRIGQPDERKV